MDNKQVEQNQQEQKENIESFGVKNGEVVMNYKFGDKGVAVSRTAEGKTVKETIYYNELYLIYKDLINDNNQEIFDLLSLTEKKFLKARYQLEGIGLLTPYMDEEQNYIYVISSPLSAKNFIKDATLGLYLYLQR